MRHLDIDILRSFVAIVETGGFTAAASRIHRSQSALSLQLKKLEGQLGKALLDRSAHHITLTHDGHNFLQYAQHILALNDEALLRLSEPDLAGIVRLGVPEDFATMHLPNLLGRFTASFPHVQLEVTCELTLPLLDKFEAGAFDLVLVKQMRAPKQTCVLKEELVWVGAPRTRAYTLASLPLVMSPTPCVYRQQAVQVLTRARTPHHVAYTCTSLGGTHAAVRAGLGVTVLPRGMVPDDLEILGRNTGLPALPDMGVSLLARAGLSKPAQKLHSVIMQSFKDR